MGLSTWHLLALLAVALLLFGGRGKISSLMGDFAEGIKAFKKGMQDDEKPAESRTAEPVKTIDHHQSTETETVSSQTESRKAS